MAAGTGTLTYIEFERCAREIAALSDRLWDGWELKSVRLTPDLEETVFLSKTSTQMTKLKSREPVQCGQTELEGSIEDCGDPATMPLQPRCAVAVQLQYHVVYSTSYEVPILYFLATFQDGKQLPLKDIWSLISDTYTSAESDRWGLVTQQEHPLLSRPFYHIHPCHTAQVMATALSCAGCYRQESDINPGVVSQPNYCSLPTKTTSNSMGGFTPRVNYLLTWLSTFGPLVGLKIPLDFNVVKS